MALVSLRICAKSHEPSMLVDAKSTEIACTGSYGYADCMPSFSSMSEGMDTSNKIAYQLLFSPFKLKGTILRHVRTQKVSSVVWV